MRRSALILLAAVVCAAVIGVVLGAGSAGDMQVAAVFDTANGMLAGQQVKIAGAVVGSVSRVTLVPGPKAELVLSIERRFAPFHQDATCQILPSGIISENYVSCDPGSASSPSLARQGTLPTVPLEHTSVPLSLQDILNIFSLPTDDRIRVLIDELGIGTAGRGEDLNALILRTNPALEQTRKLITVVNGQREHLVDAVTQTDQVLAALAKRGGDVRGFVDRAAAITSTTASRHDALAESVARLPAMLEAAQPAFHSIDHVIAETTPILPDLHAAAPGLLRATQALPPFAAAAGEELTQLAQVSDNGRVTVRAARPIVTELSSALSKLRPVASDTDLLLRNIRDGGGIEGILAWIYSMASVTSAYDSTSHVAGFFLGLLPQCISNASALGCDTNWNAPGQGTYPANDPACGPQSGAPWEPATSCVGQSVIGLERRRGASGRRPASSSDRGASTQPVAAPSGTGSNPGQTSVLPVKRPSKPPVTLPVKPPSPAPSSLNSLLSYLLGR